MIDRPRERDHRERQDQQPRGLARVRLRPARHGLHHRPHLRVPHQPGGHAGVLSSAASSRSRQAVYYWVAQLAGALLGGLLIYIISEARGPGQTRASSPPTAGAPRSAARSGSARSIVVEIVFTALLIFVVLSTTTIGYPVGFGGLAAGITLAMIHLATIPVDNTSVNPARSFGTAVFSAERCDEPAVGVHRVPARRRRRRRARVGARPRRAVSACSTPPSVSRRESLGSASSAGAPRSWHSTDGKCDRSRTGIGYA